MKTDTSYGEVLCPACKYPLVVKTNRDSGKWAIKCLRCLWGMMAVGLDHADKTISGLIAAKDEVGRATTKQIKALEKRCPATEGLMSAPDSPWWLCVVCVTLVDRTEALCPECEQDPVDYWLGKEPNYEILPGRWA